MTQKVTHIPTGSRVTEFSGRSRRELIELIKDYARDGIFKATEIIDTPDNDFAIERNGRIIRKYTRRV